MRKPFVLVAGLVLVACCGAVLAHRLNPLVPNRTIPDTRHISAFVVDSTAVQTIRDSVFYYAFRNKEAALCLYGEIGEDTLYIRTASRGLGLSSDSANSHFTCEQRHGYVGHLHSHLMSIPGVCLPSEIDLAGFASDNESLLHYVVCVNRVGFLGIRDGRLYVFLWY